MGLPSTLTCHRHQHHSGAAKARRYELAPHHGAAIEQNRGAAMDDHHGEAIDEHHGAASEQSHGAESEFHCAALERYHCAAWKQRHGVAKESVDVALPRIRLTVWIADYP